MTKAEVGERALDELSPEERRELAWHWPLVAEALAEHERDPAGALPGEELLDWLRRPRT